jgi:hypothetical protein
MRGKPFLAPWVSLAFLIAGPAPAAEFTLGFDGCPPSPVEGEPGEVKTFEIFAALTTTDNDRPFGVGAWSLSIEIIGGELDSIEVEGIIVDAVLDMDHDCDRDTDLIHFDHYPVDLGDSFTKIAAKASGALDPNRKGAISAILLHPVYGSCRSRARLQPNGTQRLAKLLVKATIPEVETDQEVILRYEDEFRSAVSQPVRNEVVFDYATYDPLRSECRFTLRKRTAPILALDFDGSPGSPVEGAPGEVKTFEVYPTLTTLGILSPDGPHSWAIGVGITGGEIKAIEIKGLLVSTVFDHDGDPSTPPLDPYLLDLGTAPSRDAELAASAVDPTRVGAISMVMLDRERKMVLQPNGTQRIARVRFEAVVPDTDDPKEVVLRFEDGFGGRRNWINLDDLYAPPTLGECRFTLVKETPKTQVPGDSDQSGSLDLADAIAIFGTLFQGSPQDFPCGDGSPSDPGNLSLLDWQGDGAIDISDGVGALRFLFLGGPAHHLAVPGNEFRGCAPIYGCPESATCR